MLNDEVHPGRDGLDRPDRGDDRGGEAPLRDSIVRDVLAGAVQDSYAGFLAASSPVEALAAWCGPDLLRIVHQLGASALHTIIDRDIAALDTILTTQLDAILRHPDLQALEARWRGVAYLLDAAGNDAHVQIRILPVTWPEIARDLEKALEFDQSAIFAKIYSDEFGMPGGLPYGLILCDHFVRHRRDASYRIDDISVLGGLAQVAAAAFAPCLVGAAPQLCGVENFSELAIVQDLTSAFRRPEYERWHGLQKQDDSRFLGVVLPRILLRPAWGDDGARTDGFRFREERHDADGRSWLWGNGIYAVGALAIRAFRNWGWFADIRGTRVDAEDAGLIVGLPSPAFSTLEACAYRRPIELELTDRRQRAFEEIGMIALSPCHLTEYLAMLSTPSLHVPQGALDTTVDANERLSAMLHYVLCASRFAHYIKVIARDRIGAYTTSDELQTKLQTWISQYTTGNPEASFEIKASYPLSSARVEVGQLAGKPGSYNCTVHLSPHFQIDQVLAAFRFQTEIRAARP